MKSLLATPMLAVLFLTFISTTSARSVDIDLEFDKSTQTRVVSEYLHEGDVVVPKASDKTQTNPLPMRVQAHMDYFQRYTGNASENQAIRFYREAKSSIKVDDGTTAAVLSNGNRHIVTRVVSGSARPIQVASLGDALQQSELDLLRNPGDPLTVPALLNRENVSKGDKWDAPKKALGSFLSVDRILKSDVKLLLKSIENGQAKIYFSGKVRANVDDVKTDIELSGLVVANLKDRSFSTVRLSIREQRKQGQLAPGFYGRTKIETRLSSVKPVKQLSTSVIKQLTAGKKIQQRLKWVSEAGRFQVKYDPSWRLIASEKEAAILRFLSEGESMAQCSIVRLASRPADNPLTLETFKKEVTSMVDVDKDAKLVSAEQLKSRSGLNILEIQVSGVVEEVPLNWMYFHVSNNQGRCVTFVFTLEEELAGEVRPAARKLVSNLTFLLQKSTRKSQAKRSTEPSRQVR
ncbi:hypothetical protein N9L06_02490 [Mariniblastus sp.]|nr:hypothetical protein [Mariniblastus sp.]